jgi:molecular chaperone DnaK
MSNYHKVIGIDLGTTFSVVSAFNNETGKPEAFYVPGKMPPTCILPSVVSVSRSGSLLVGWQAKRNIMANPANTVIEVKRDMGTDRRFTLGGHEFNAPMISAMVLRELKTVAEQKIGDKIYDAVVTVPAYFKFVQRQATEEAAKIAELNARLLINEPTAAAIAYRGLYQREMHTTEEGIYIVYDLGGGTFDVSVISLVGESVEVMGTAGDDKLGGGDFDDDITNWAFEASSMSHLKDRSDVRPRVKAAAEQAKIDLSGAEIAVIDVPNLAGGDMYCELDRKTFIDLLQRKRQRPQRKEPVGLLDETLFAVEEAVASARKNFAEKRGREDFGVSDITAFLMVGGSTRIPAVRDLLAQRFKKDVIFDPELVDLAVSLGASIQARAITPMDKFGEKASVAIPDRVGASAAPVPPPVDLVDVTGHSLGVAVGHGEFHVIIGKDRDIPARETHRDFTTAQDNQPAVRVEVYQGEDPVARNNTLLGALVFDNLQSRPRGYYLFDVTFILDKSGLLELIVTSRVADNSRPPATQSAKFNAGPGTPVKPEELQRRREQLEALFRTGGLDPMSGMPPIAQARAATAQVAQQSRPPAVPAVVPSAQPGTQPATASGDIGSLIPVDYRDTWTKAKERAAALSGPRKTMLQVAIRHFESAVQSGDAGAIEEYGSAMIETYFANLR